jgi:hypothetical protein
MMSDDVPFLLQLAEPLPPGRVSTVEPTMRDEQGMQLGDEEEEAKNENAEKENEAQQNLTIDYSDEDEVDEEKDEEFLFFKKVELGKKCKFPPLPEEDEKAVSGSFDNSVYHTKESTEFLLKRLSDYALQWLVNCLYYAPYVALINSSMLGKSRGILQLSTAGVFVICLCLRPVHKHPL